MGEPITLFGETEQQANVRMQALKNVEKQYLKAVQKQQDAEDGEGSKHKLELKVYSTNLTYQNLLELANDLRRGDAKHDEMVISEWIKVMMTWGGHELNSRHEGDIMTVKGKMESATYTQTKGYVKPLLKLLRKNQCNDDIRDSLSNMVKFIMQRDYILASEKYMEMSIGNAPWPIGVTNAGIHARPGRERIYSNNVGHVLNDESQRKYIQGLKRLMTKSQQYFPTDPSRSVDFSRVGGQEDVVEKVEMEPPAKTFEIK